MLMFRRYRDLTAQGVMGMNRRNVSYIGRYNRRALFPLVDDKLKTKRLAIEHQVTVPCLIGVVSHQHEVRNIDHVIAGHRAFCIKPAKGSGGKGILVITKVEDGIFYRSNGQSMTLSELQRHVSNILAGLFSLGGATDAAMIEDCIEVEEALANFSYEGVPDIRVIVFKGIPVMAMMRLSCSDSHGKANLHQGAIGVGLCLGTGKAVNAVKNDAIIHFHPDTNQDLRELQLPKWDGLLALACACSDMTGLGYLGVDLVIDKNLGPMLLELNARPGLSIQIANNEGLLPRLRKIESISHPERWSAEQKIAFAQEHFSAALCTAECH
ncbi:MAG: alpha-L-glutamate ligase-like protein [Agarilytica sp.]